MSDADRPIAYGLVPPITTKMMSGLRLLIAVTEGTPSFAGNSAGDGFPHRTSKTGAPRSLRALRNLSTTIQSVLFMGDIPRFSWIPAWRAQCIQLWRPDTVTRHWKSRLTTCGP
jgi:hypothetical protein